MVDNITKPQQNNEFSGKSTPKHKNQQHNGSNK